MSLSDPRSFYGVHSFSPYSRTDGSFYGIVKCIGKSSLALSGDTIELVGGSNRFPWAVEDGAIKAELSITPKSYEDFLFTIFLGKAPTATGADTSGTVSTLTNKKGTSAVAATGMASVGVKSGSKADLKFTKYVVLVVSASTVDVYAGSDVDFARGTDLDYQNDLLKITASPLTVVASTAVTIPSAGLEITGGAGTIGMTIGDTATFEVKPNSLKSMAVTVGGLNDVYPEFGALIMAQRRGNQEMMELDVFRCKGIGLPLGFEEKKWSEAELKAKCFFDSARSGVFSVRHITLND
jgi:hypothetical protein